MVAFVWVATDHGPVCVNPAAVNYLRPIAGGTSVVFGAFAGGLHELRVNLGADDLAQLLRVSPEADFPAAGAGRPASGGKGPEPADRPPGGRPGRPERPSRPDSPPRR